MVKKQYHFRMHPIHDADVIEFLEAEENKQGLIKRLIRMEISRREREDEGAES